jgi:hypothetical protein
MVSAPLSPAQLRLLLHYDPNTGVLTWRSRNEGLFADAKHSAARKCKAWNSRMAGREAFTAVGHGYLKGSILNRRYAAHRVAWAIVHGVWPSGQIDHINGNRADNRLCNLRDTDSATNGKNQRLGVNNKSGVNGVHFDRNRWVARIKVAGKVKHLGRFENFEDAVAARREADRRFGFHPNHGLPK